MNDIQIFQLLGLIYFSIGLGAIINFSAFKKVLEDFINNQGLLFLGGMLALVLGYLLIITHSVWELKLSVIINIIGWLAAIKGIILLLSPSWLIKLYKNLIKRKAFLRFGLILIIILGMFFLFLGYYL